MRVHIHVIMAAKVRMTCWICGHIRKDKTRNTCMEHWLRFCDMPIGEMWRHCNLMDGKEEDRFRRLGDGCEI